MKWLEDKHNDLKEIIPEIFVGLNYPPLEIVLNAEPTKEQIAAIRDNMGYDVPYIINKEDEQNSN